MPNRILIHIHWPVKAWCIPDAHVDALRSRFPDVEFVHARTLEDAAGIIPGVDAAFTPFLTPPMVASAGRLRWVHSSAAAVEGLLPLADLAARDVAVTNSRGVQAVAIAEQVMGGLLVVSRKIDRTLTAQRERRWIQNDLSAGEDWPWVLHGRRMTIVGLGTIGLEVAKRAHAFGMKITGIRRRTDQLRPDFVNRVVTPDHLDDAIRDADVLVLAAPGVAATRRMIAEPQLDLLAPGAVVVNVARSQIVDEPALRQRLESGRLGGAVLDVFDQEPLPPESPLWGLPNVVMTPHSSGFRADHWDDVVDLFAENLRRYKGGEPLLNVVDVSAGY